jgi:hypothetical protein
MGLSHAGLEPKCFEHKRKGRLRCHKRPKSREETPKEGSDSGGGVGGRYRIPLAKTIALNSSIERRDHGPKRRFMALALKAEHFCKGVNADIGQLPGEVCSRKRSFQNRSDVRLPVLNDDQFDLDGLVDRRRSFCFGAAKKKLRPLGRSLVAS